MNKIPKPTYTEYALLVRAESAEYKLRRLAKDLEQIAIVCTDNMDRDCDHRLALEFVRQIANRESQS